MEPSSEAGAQAGDMRRGEGAVVPATEGRGPGLPFRLKENADLPGAVRRVGEDYWPEAMGAAEAPAPLPPIPEPPSLAPLAPMPPPEMSPISPLPVAPVQQPPPMLPMPAAPAPGALLGEGDRVAVPPAPPGLPPAPALPSPVPPSPVAWGEAGGFPRPPKSVAVPDVRGPVFFEALKDPVSILMAVLLAAVVGGMGTYLGWRLGGEETLRQAREETEKRLISATADAEARHSELEKQLQEARARVAEIERANAVLEQQGKEREKALAAAHAMIGPLKEEIEGLKQAKAQGEGASAQVGDLVALRGEQGRLVGLLREAVGEACEVGEDGPYVFVRPKAPLYAEGSNKPAEAIIEAMKKVAVVAKAYGGPYRLQVEGHTDSSPGPTVAGQGSNLHAGAMRALDVAQVLADAGVPAAKMSLISQGEAFPVRGGADAAASKANRRVEIVFAPTRTVVATAPAAPVAETLAPAGGAASPAEMPEAPRAIPVVTIPPEAQTPPAPNDPAPEAPAVIQTGTVREAEAPPQ